MKLSRFRALNGYGTSITAEATSDLAGTSLAELVSFRHG